MNTRAIYILNICLLATIIGCNNSGGGNSSDPNKSPTGRTYPTVSSLGKFERLKDVNPSDKSRHACSDKSDDEVKIDSGFEVGKSFVVSEKQTWFNGAKENIRWAGTITKKTDKSFTYIRVIKESEGQYWYNAGDEYAHVCEVKAESGNTAGIAEFISCSETRMKKGDVRTNDSPLQGFQFCNIKGSIFGKSGDFLQSSDGKFFLNGDGPNAPQKSLDSQVYGFVDKGIIECDGKEMGKGSITTVGVRTADQPDILSPSYSRNRCGSALFWSQTTRLDDGTVINEHIQEVLDIDPL